MVAWRVQGNLKDITAQIKTKFPKATVYSVGDASHASRSSDHNPWNWGYGTVVSAIDVMIRNGFTKAHAKALVKDLIGRPDIQYVIYNRTIWSASYGWKARSYTGPDPHTDHVHVSAKHTKTADKTAKALGFLVSKVAETIGKIVTKPAASKPAKPTSKIREKAPTWPMGPGAYYEEVRSGPIRVNDNVKKFQAELKQRGWDIDADGRFGEGTRRIVEAFQKEKKLKTDGKVGPVTWKAIWESPVK